MGVAGASAFSAQAASAQTNSSAVVESTSSVQSDEIGNIIDVDGMEFVWEGRQLQSIGANGTPFFSYEYNIDGQRTKKTVTDFDTGETTTTEYFYNSGMLMGQKTGNDVLVFMYDESGDMFGFTYNGAQYYYIKNAQNDVWAVTNADGQAVVLYFYDAWGNVTRSYEADGYEAIAEVNPILYRSYYCDLELGFYYLNTRYYVPAIHRFLCADSYAQTGQGMLDKNMFAYCLNSPVNLTDDSGALPFFAITAAIGAVAGAVIGGIAAARSGSSVWAGIGIGAAAGALIGTGAGMAAGAALAGSITATTGAVIAGGSTLVGTVATGGLGAGAAYVANNLSQAVNNSAPVVQAGASRMRQVVEKGKAGEIASGLVKNTQRIYISPIQYRIPDGLDTTNKILSEVKNYSSTLSYTAQLRDFVSWSQANGYQMHLYTNAPLTGPLQQAVDSGLIQVFPLQ